MQHEQIRAELAAATEALDAAAAGVRTHDDYNDYVGNPGIASDGSSAPECETAFTQAKSRYVAAKRAEYSHVHGPMLREYYSR